MTETLNNIKRDYPTFEFHDGPIVSPWKADVIPSAKIISCENEMYYLSVQQRVERNREPFVVIATSLQTSTHYVKQFASEGGLRLYLSSVMVLGI